MKWYSIEIINKILSDRLSVKVPPTTMRRWIQKEILDERDYIKEKIIGVNKPVTKYSKNIFSNLILHNSNKLLKLSSKSIKNSDLYLLAFDIDNNNKELEPYKKTLNNKLNDIDKQYFKYEKLVILEALSKKIGVNESLLHEDIALDNLSPMNLEKYFPTSLLKKKKSNT
ncbi:hypothetical protein [Lactiplantibacillus plantarum]|uniref:hypothetical protein n=1 Tax=Lactiplantibacillus plantarum TaxID=1590 RepID=UPI00106BE709|nr:hypothetical protein [Lactiplantibacillus plantarum]MDN3985711.1 hypothetical protein [Lactiplantibacillus plantarum]VFI63649.1 hypothetical protein LAP9571_02871 [Lactiplantibacillus plantarum]VFI64340.1 hypothetical protein LAP9492_03071 [Lactiplantibacillus plantarum]